MLLVAVKYRRINTYYQYSKHFWFSDKPDCLP